MTRHIHGRDLDAETAIEIERASIRDWVLSCQHVLGGRVLDYGSGQQPYRHIVEAAGGEYVPHDLTSYPSSVATDDDPMGPPYSFDAILCTQVLQYVPLYNTQGGEPTGAPLFELLDSFRVYLSLFDAHGWLVMTGGTCWREIEPADHSRLTVAGIRVLLEQVGFRVEQCESRARIDFPGFSLSLGWGVLAQA